jgi:hypothetical protein
MTTVLSCPLLPSTLNEIIGVARRHPHASAQLKKRWHKTLGPYVGKLKRIGGPVYIECVWIVKNRRRDPDNICAATKYIFDTMVEYNKIDDDSMKVIQSPVIHHYLIDSFDGFIIYVRDRQDFVSRVFTNIVQPPSDSGNIINSLRQNVANLPSRKKKRKSN